MDGSSTATELGTLSLAQRFIGMFTAPRTVLDDLQGSPRVLGALLVVVLLAIVTGVLLTDVILADQEAQMARGDTTEEQIQQFEDFRGVSKIITPLFWGFGYLIPVFLVAGVLLLIGNVVLGGDATYKQFLSGMAHIGFISVAQFAVLVPLALSAGTMDVATSLAALLPRGGEKGVLHFALAQIDLFEIWRLVLSVMAVSVFARVPTQRAAVGVVGGWILWSIAWVLAQSMLSGLTG